LNIVLDDAVEQREGGQKVPIGTVVIRGNSVVMLEVRFHLGVGGGGMLLLVSSLLDLGLWLSPTIEGEAMGIV
jgi:hypothetical protein